jgi:hypothetical protein
MADTALLPQARYCGAECQKCDWARHSDYCAQAMQRRAERRANKEAE